MGLDTCQNVVVPHLGVGFQKAARFFIILFCFEQELASLVSRIWTGLVKYPSRQAFLNFRPLTQTGCLVVGNVQVLVADDFQGYRGH